MYGWANRKLNFEIIEEGFSETIISPVQTKLKNIGIGTPYRDSRIFFYNFMEQNHPDMIPENYKREVDAGKVLLAKDINEVFKPIFEMSSETEKIASEFLEYANKIEENGHSRLTNFVYATSGRRKLLKGLEKPDLETIEKTPFEKELENKIEDDGSGLSDDQIEEKGAIKITVSNLLNDLSETGIVSNEALMNVADALKKIDNMKTLVRFIDYIEDIPGYEEIHQGLLYALDLLESEGYSEDAPKTTYMSSDDDLKKASLTPKKKRRVSPGRYTRGDPEGLHDPLEFESVQVRPTQRQINESTRQNLKKRFKNKMKFETYYGFGASRQYR